MTRLFCSRWLCCLWLAGPWGALGCGSEPPAPAGPPPIPAGPGPRAAVATTTASAGVFAVSGTSGSLSTPPSNGIATAAAVGGGDAQGLDAGVLPVTAAGTGGSAGLRGMAGQGGSSTAGRNASGAGGASGSGGAAGASDEVCRDVFCFTAIECLFWALPCGFTDCENFTCK